jgi:hypothetical protein
MVQYGSFDPLSFCCVFVFKYEYICSEGYIRARTATFHEHTGAHDCTTLGSFSVVAIRPGHFLVELKCMALKYSVDNP